jgi:NAD(P)H-hydrate epimerase
MERIESIPSLPPRRADGHKGDFGRVLVVGGSTGMIGAPGLAAAAALRGGAGLVTIAAPAPVQQSVAMLCQCATSIPLACSDDGQLAAGSVRQLCAAAEAADILAVGPGMGTGPAQCNLVRAALESHRPTVLDADGLNNLADIDDWPQLPTAPLVLTPHPGEFARLTGKNAAEVQADRQKAAQEAIDAWQSPELILVLKGAETVVTDGRRMFVNPSGNPGMASGGSGDVLTGLAAGLAMQFPPEQLFDAVCLAVYVHGRAGDLAAKELTQVAMIASDLLDFLPDAMKEVCK